MPCMSGEDEGRQGRYEKGAAAAADDGETG